MCFYCIEGTGIEIAKALASGQDLSEADEHMPAFALFSILEQADPVSAIAHSPVASLVPEMGDNASFVEQTNAVACLSAIMARTCEILVGEGFQSSQYQHLIASSLVQHVIAWYCRHTAIWDRNRFPVPAPLQHVFHPDVFFTEAGAQHLHSEGLQVASKDILKHYVAWWYSRRANAEIELFLHVFPVVFLSFVLLQQWCPDDPALAQLVTTRLHVPFGYNLDMWLQRKAARHLYLCAGLTAFLPYGQRCRPVILYDLVVTQHLTFADCQHLKQAIVQSAEYDPERTIAETHQRLRLFYMDTDQFILAAIHERIDNETE